MPLKRPRGLSIILVGVTSEDSGSYVTDVTDVTDVDCGMIGNYGEVWEFGADRPNGADGI